MFQVQATEKGLQVLHWAMKMTGVEEMTLEDFFELEDEGLVEGLGSAVDYAELIIEAGCKE